jgi:GNAT superfamily N-acetyltransferase
MTSSHCARTISEALPKNCLGEDWSEEGLAFILDSFRIFPGTRLNEAASGAKIGVDPARQGAGYGTELMKHSLQRCDADRKLAYLESSNPRNVPFYERLGSMNGSARFKRERFPRSSRC